VSTAAASPAAADLGQAPEQEIALDIARRALPFAPLVVGLAALGWGWAGAASAAYALGLVVANLLLAATLLAWAGRISLGALMGAALGGYVLRIALVGAAVWFVKDAAWVEPGVLGTTLIVTHLGLLLWELRFVSASLAYPGLAPASPRKETSSC
jgi:hypothetical protein